MRYEARLKGRKATISGRVRTLAGLHRAIRGVERHLGTVVTAVEVDMDDALEIGLVSDTKVAEIDTAFGDRVYKLVLVKRSPMAEMGRKGGERSGKRKRRGDTEYYRQLAKRRVR
jgi:hypothetical protein